MSFVEDTMCPPLGNRSNYHALSVYVTCEEHENMEDMWWGSVYHIISLASSPHHYRP